MKKIELVNLYKALNEVKAGGKFAYGVLKNKKQLQSEFDNLAEIENKSVDKIKPFNDEKIELFKKYGKQNDDGSIYIDKDDKEAINKITPEMNKLNEKYKGILAIYEKEMKELNDILQEDVDVEFVPYKINDELIPDDLDVKVLEVMMDCGIIE